MSGEKYTVHRVNDVSASKSKEVPHQDQKVDERTTPLDDNTHKDMLMIAKMLHDEDTPKAGSSDDTWQVVERKNRRKRFLAKYNPPIQPLAPGRVRVCEICMMKGIPFRCRCHDEESTHEGDSTDPAGGSATDVASSHKVPADYEKWMLDWVESGCLTDEVFGCSTNQNESDPSFHTGNVRSWTDKGFGFIRSAKDGRDYFIHVKELSGPLKRARIRRLRLWTRKSVSKSDTTRSEEKTRPTSVGCTALIGYRTGTTNEKQAQVWKQGPTLGTTALGRKLSNPIL